MDLLPTLNEGDERVSLGDILLQRDGCLTETELWAVCKECCLALQGVHVSSDMFQTLCVTPDSVAFDTCGTVCFLDLAAGTEGLFIHPEPMYVPPEYESVGNSYKAHLFSLGMTLLFAAEYNVSMAVQRPFSADLGHTINKMTLDDFEERADLGFVIDMCSSNLGERLSDDICAQLATSVRIDASADDVAFFTFDNDDDNSQWKTATSQSPLFINHAHSPDPDSCSPSPSHSVSASGESTPRLSDNHESGSIPGESGSVPGESGSVPDSPLSPRKTPTKRSSPFEDTPGVITPPDLFNSLVKQDIDMVKETSTESSPAKMQKTCLSGEAPDLVSSTSNIAIEFTSDLIEESVDQTAIKDTLLSDLATNSAQVKSSPNDHSDVIKTSETMPEANKDASPLIPSLSQESALSADIEVTPHDTDTCLTANEGLHTNEGVSSDTFLANTSQSPQMITPRSARNQEAPTQLDQKAGQTPGQANGSEGASKETHSRIPLRVRTPKTIVTSPNAKTNGDLGDESNQIRNSTKSDLPALNSRRIETNGAGKTNPALKKTNDSTLDANTGDDVLLPRDTNTARKSRAGTTPLVKPQTAATPLSPAATPSSQSVSATLAQESSLSAQHTGVAEANQATGPHNICSNTDKKPLTNDHTRSHTHGGDLNASSVSNGSGATQSLTFNEVFGSRVHRDTSTDSLSLIRESDILSTQSDLSLDTTQDSVTSQESATIQDSVTSQSETIPDLLTSDTDKHDVDGMKAGMDRLSGSTSLKRRVRERHKSQQKGQTVVEILERLGLGLHEAEVWALCRECVLAMQRNRLELPAYVSTETVVIEDTGRVTFLPVPSDKNLDVEFLAPELQQHGIVTEKSCLFGLAAMLWSTADFGLSPNHEPLLSNDLESLLLSMTNESADSRPTAIDVLQVCNEFQKKQETTSTKICQNLAAEARKAADFDKKNNRLVQDIIEEDTEVKLQTTKAQLVHSIKTDQPQANLKPAADRDIPELVKEPTLHERLMTEIRKPNKKLRKTSRPRVMNVQEMYRNNPDLLHDLLRVTGKQTTPSPAQPSHPLSDPSHPLSDHSPAPASSAFSPGAVGAFTRTSSQSGAEGERERGGSAASNASQGSVPDAYKSKLTHFTPIIVSEGGAGSESGAAKAEPKPVAKARTAQEEENVAQKIKQLKKNLLKNRPPINLVQDIENDVMQEEQNLEETKEVHKTPPSVTTPEKAAIPPNSLPVPNMNPPFAPAQSPLLGYPTLPQQAPGIPLTPGSDSHLQYLQQPPIVDPNNLTGSVPNLAAGVPISYPGMPQSLPYQLQLQQDPRTGLFQLIPVLPPMALTPQHLPFPAQSPGHFLGMSQTPHMDLLQSNQSKSQPMSPYSGSSTDGERPERVRHPRKKPSRDRRAAGSKQSKHSDSDGRRSHDSSPGQGQSQRSRRRSDDTDDNLTDTQNSNGLSGKSSDLSPVFEHRSLRPSSVEILDKPDSNGSTQPRTPRTVKMRDLRNKLKRAKSGSSVDFRPPGQPSSETVKSYEIYDDTYLCNKKLYANLSRSQPNLDTDLLSLEVTGKSKSPSPPSPDSGVSGTSMYLMERLLAGDTQRQHRLSKIIKFIRDEFAFDGFMENGIEEQAMAEYILSLGNLSFSTFSGAITEKYEDLYFEEDLVLNLYDAVNGRRPVAERRSTPHSTDVTAHARVISVDEGDCQLRGELKGPSAFRPISDPGSSMRIYSNQASQGESIVKPKAVKYQKHQQRQDWRPPPANKALEKGKSSSLHDLLSDDMGLKDSSISARVKSRSQEDLLSQHDVGSRDRDNDDVTPRDDVIIASKPKVIKVKSADNATDSVQAQTVKTSKPISDANKFKSKSTFTMNRQDSSSSSTSGGLDQRFGFGGIQNGVFRQHPLMRTDSFSSGSSGVSGDNTRLTNARSESYLATVINNALSTPSKITTAQHYREMSRMGRGSVVYYCAEMESRMRKDVKDYAAQIMAKEEVNLIKDPQTKENIESKMAELDQQMMVEHRNKKKTQKYYRKLVDATKASKVSGEHKVKLATVSKQIEESSNRLDFLDAAKKHLEMLHAEQWGLDTHHLYALAKCSADEPMLLGMCDNPLLQYQLVRNPRLGIEGHFLQAGQPDGLMAYLFAQNALSEGYIHHFFYTYRYFTTPESLLHFIATKHTAACMSLQPGAEIPVQVKARALDLIQVWVEGYYGIDFRHNEELLQSCLRFLQEKVLPVDSSAELIIELIEEYQDGNRKDLHYPEFTCRKQDSNNNAEAEQPLKKWESFKAALHLNAKPMKLPKSDVRLKPGARPMEEGMYQPSANKRVEALSILEHGTQVIAEQLTLLQQALFQQSHPVHYLNSKHLGISVALLNPTIQKTQTLTRASNSDKAWEGVESDSLFVCEAHTDDVIQRMIEHAQNVAFWVAAEIVSCSSQKTQVALLTKFIHVARCLQDMRNYATCIAIVDGLENLIVRQLPAWKNLPSKAASMKEELSSLKLFLKSDSMCFSEDDKGITARRPTMPSVLLFLIHVQQLEIGGFKLANQMYRWSKLKSIATMVDQIRVFRQHPYTCSPDATLQHALRMRINEYASQDLHTLASQHATNVPKISGGKMSLFKKKKKYKLDS